MSRMKLAILGSARSRHASAHGPEAKVHAQQDVKIDVKLSDRVKPIHAEDRRQEGHQADADGRRRPLDRRARRQHPQRAGADPRRARSTQTPDSEVEEKSDYYFRLGELYAKQQRYWRLKASSSRSRPTRAKTPREKAKLKNDAETAAEQGQGLPAEGGEDLQGPHRQRRVPQLPEDGHGAVLLRVHAAGRQVHEGGARGLRQAAQELPEVASTSPRRTSRSPTTTSRPASSPTPRAATRWSSSSRSRRRTGTRCTRWAGSISTCRASRRRSRRSSRSRRRRRTTRSRRS